MFEVNTAYTLRDKMTEESFTTTSHLSVAMTTTSATDEIHTTSGITNTPSSSNTADVIFKCAVVIIGIVGASANALVLYAMIVSDQHKKQLLIFNQNIFDLSSCVFLVITYTLKLCDIYLTGTLGYWVCVLLLSENLLWCCFNGGVINLLIVTTERYLKVVHHGWSKKFLRKWMIYSAMAFAWMAGTSYNMAVVFTTTAVINGVCYGYVFWPSRHDAYIVGI